jgi:hypothetical protein
MCESWLFFERFKVRPKFSCSEAKLSLKSFLTKVFFLYDIIPYTLVVVSFFADSQITDRKNVKIVDIKM